MSLFKSIVLVLILLTVVIDSRTRRKRRQEPRSSAYFGSYGSNAYPYVSYGNNWYPIGNSWYVPNSQAYPYNYQFGYNSQQYPYGQNYGYPSWYNTFTAGQSGVFGVNNQYSGMSPPFTGQSYMPPSNDWLPLPGRDRRRRSLGQVIIASMNKNRARSSNQ